MILKGLYEGCTGAVVLAPGLDILNGLFAKCHPDVAADLDLSGVGETLRRLAMERRGFYTTRRYHNLLMSAVVPPPPVILIDESHHTLCETDQTIRALANNPPMVGVTATPYRGTPEETRKLRELWGAFYVALSLKDAVDKKIIARPDFSVWPLVDDETIAVSNGEFVTSAVEAALEDKYDDIARRVCGLPPRPTMVRCPGVGSAERVAGAIRAVGGVAALVVGNTPARDRADAFIRAAAGTAILVQVKVVGEGVDLPLRRLIDLAPTMSPVAWQQALGRITRPTSETPEYIATNHNLTRHAYLWAGLIPSSQIAKAQQAWAETGWKPKRRTMARALGLEGFGKFTVTPVPMIDGSAGSLYSLQTQDGLRQYAVFLHPCMEEPLYFTKNNALTGRTITTANGYTVKEKDWGKWSRAEAVPPADGYATVKPRQMTEPMQSTWERLAESRGLDPAAKVDARSFETLFLFLNTRTKFKVTG